jgi:hypothetical protein
MPSSKSRSSTIHSTLIHVCFSQPRGITLSGEDNRFSAEKKMFMNQVSPFSSEATPCEENVSHPQHQHRPLRSPRKNGVVGMVPVLVDHG